jgi:hypothetical protein
MPQFMSGNLLDHLSSYHSVLITTNGVIKAGGALVMGRGIAQSVRDTYPGFDKAAGAAVSHRGLQLADSNCYLYHILWPAAIPHSVLNIGLFQVKMNWWDPASVKLIDGSALRMATALEASPLPAGVRIGMNFPGIGNGQLTVDQVMPYLTQIPDCVDIWTFTPLEQQHAQNTQQEDSVT